MENEMKILADAMVAFVPADAKGLLFVKIRADSRVEPHIARMGIVLNEALEQAEVRCSSLVVVEHEGFELSLHMLTDDQLRDIGFERIQKPKPDLTDITRSFG